MKRTVGRRETAGEWHWLREQKTGRSEEEIEKPHSTAKPGLDPVKRVRMSEGRYWSLQRMTNAATLQVEEDKDQKALVEMMNTLVPRS